MNAIVTKNFLIRLQHNQYQSVIDRWAQRLHDQTVSIHKISFVPKLDSFCKQRLDTFQALLKERKDPRHKDFLRDLIVKRDEWNLETPDITPFFRALRKTLFGAGNRGDNLGSPDWNTRQPQLEPSVGTGATHIVQDLEESD